MALFMCTRKVPQGRSCRTHPHGQAHGGGPHGCSCPAHAHGQALRGVPGHMLMRVKGVAWTAWAWCVSWCEKGPRGGLGMKSPLHVVYGKPHKLPLLTLIMPRTAPLLRPKIQEKVQVCVPAPNLNDLAPLGVPMLPRVAPPQTSTGRPVPLHARNPSPSMFPLPQHAWLAGAPNVKHTPPGGTGGQAGDQSHQHARWGRLVTEATNTPGDRSHSTCPKKCLLGRAAGPMHGAGGHVR